MKFLATFWGRSTAELDAETRRRRVWVEAETAAAAEAAVLMGHVVDGDLRVVPEDRYDWNRRPPAFEFVRIDGANLVTDRGMVSLSPAAYADGGKTTPAAGEDYAVLRRHFVASPVLADVLRRLLTAVLEVTEEQTSAKMGFGRTPAEKTERAAVYAAAIAKAAGRLDGILDEAGAVLDALEPSKPAPAPEPPHGSGYGGYPDGAEARAIDRGEDQHTAHEPKRKA
jgi:hypothetical protein